MKAERNLWIQKKKKIIMLIAAVMAVIFLVSFVSFFKTDEVDVPEEKKPYESMYNASRYFFRVFYPDDWDVSAEQYGFLMDEEGLVLELFPLKKILSTPGVTGTVTPTSTPTAPTGSGASATVDPRAGMERNTDLTMKIYYKEYGDIKDKINLSKENTVSDATSTATDEHQSTQSPAPEKTAAVNATVVVNADDKTAPVKLFDLAEYLFDEFKSNNKDSEYNYIFNPAETYKGENVNYYVLPYTYVKDDIKMSGEMYVASRKMCYYVIYVEGTASSFVKYNKVFENILYNLKFSVFDY